MKKILLMVILGVATVTALTGCIVEPWGHEHHHRY